MAAGVPLPAMAGGVAILLVIIVVLVLGALGLALYGTGGLRDDGRERHQHR